jgi:hypothetical protein
LVVVTDTGGSAGPEAPLAGTEAAGLAEALPEAAATGALAPPVPGAGSADLVQAPSAQTKASPKAEIRIKTRGERSVKVFMDVCSCRKRGFACNASPPKWRPAAQRRDLSRLAFPHCEFLN